MTLLITGGRSPIAQALAAQLAARHTVTLLDLPGQAAELAGVRYAAGDWRDPQQAAHALAGISAVLHLAPLTMPSDSALDDVSLLDLATRGTYVLFNAARNAGIERFIVAGTLDLFDRLPAHYHVNEGWRPRPVPTVHQLSPWLAELSARENTRASTMQAICLRFGQIVTPASLENDHAGKPHDPRWVHVDDAVHGAECALRYAPPTRPDWSIFHIMAAGSRAKIRHTHAISAQEDFGYHPQHDFAAWPAMPSAIDSRHWREILAPKATPSRPIYRVAIFGAGGPMGAITTQELSSSYRLRITDIRPIDEIAAEAKPQSPGAPLPILLGEPHETRVVDVRDPQQVLDAAQDMDALINCTVVRPHPVDAFLVNTIGAYNVMTAAVAHQIRRVVHTGPLVQHLTGYGDYRWDYDLHVDAPARPFDQLYIHSKYLGQEICRVFAEFYGLEVPVLLFTQLFNPQVRAKAHPFMISWPDTGRALRRALEVLSLPNPYEMMNIAADVPHGRFNHDKAHSVLDWQPRDLLEDFWQDAPAQPPPAPSEIAD